MSDEKTLNRRIAEMLGFTVKPVPSLEDKTRIAYYLYCDPTGEGVYYADDMISVPVTGHNEAAAWERGNLDYEHNLDAIVNALPRDWYDISIRAAIEGGYYATIYEDDPPMGYKHRWEGKGETRQKAAAYALLAWAEAKAKPTP